MIELPIEQLAIEAAPRDDRVWGQIGESLVEIGEQVDRVSVESRPLRARRMTQVLLERDVAEVLQQNYPVREIFDVTEGTGSPLDSRSSATSRNGSRAPWGCCPPSSLRNASSGSCMAMRLVGRSAGAGSTCTRK
jgi:hypothetical protein